MLVEIDEFVVDKNLWQRAEAGDRAAKDEIRTEIDGMFLYMHALSMPEGNWHVVTLRDLERLGIVGSVELHMLRLDA